MRRHPRRIIAADDIAERSPSASRNDMSSACARAMSVPTSRLFLIDGSNQMYRAYHAIRGLTGPDGQSTQRGLRLRHHAAQADRRPSAGATSPRRSISPGRRSDREMSADYKANRSPMPPDLVEQVPLVHDACAALGVPILSIERFEADDVMGTLARQAAGQPASRSCWSPATRTSSSSSAVRSRSTTRATRARGSTPPACARSSACAPIRWSTCSR